MLVIACNTASAVALYLLEEAWQTVPVIGVIEPGARAGVAATRNRRIAVIATEGTVKGGAYARAIRKLMRDAEIVQQPCQVFVALAEEGWTASPATHAAAEHYLGPLFRAPCVADTLVLGCTHFPVLAEVDPRDHRRGRGARRLGGDHGEAVVEALARARIWRQRSRRGTKRSLLRHRFARTLRPRGQDLPRAADRNGRGRAGRSPRLKTSDLRRRLVVGKHGRIVGRVCLFEIGRRLGVGSDRHLPQQALSHGPPEQQQHHHAVDQRAPKTKRSAKYGLLAEMLMPESARSNP